MNAMSARLARLCIFAAAGLVVPRCACGQNMLANPSFEQQETRGNLTVPAGWDAWSYPGTTLQYADGPVHSGTGSGVVAVAPEGADAFPLFCQRFAVEAGQRYRARIWARTEDVASSWGPQLNFEFFDAAGKRLPYVEGGQAGGGTHDWVTLTLEAYVPRDAAQLMFSAFLHGTGKAWFDDAELVKVSDADAFDGTQVILRVKPDQVLTAEFLGFGCEGDNFLDAPFNASRGVTAADRQLVRDRVAAMRPKIMRLLFDYKWWEPTRGGQGGDNAVLQGLVDWISFLESIDCDVLIHPWGDQFAYSPWMLPDNDPHWWQHRDSRLPIPSAREAMVHSLADFICYLRHAKKLANVRYVCLMNEPENDFRRPTPPDEYIRLTRLLAQCLKERGLDREVLLLGPDDCTAQYNGTSLWWRQTVPGTIDVLGGFSSHTYKHRDTRMLRAWIEDRLLHARQLDPDGPVRPLLVTEFGYTGLESGTFDNPENNTYEYGLFMGDFAIETLNARASGALMWCLFDQYYDATHCQHYGLWEFKDRDWRPRPAFYSWSLINRYSEKGSRVVAVEITPQAQQLRGAALVSPAGNLTLMLVNRYDRDMQVELHAGLPRSATLRVYRYTPATISAGNADSIPASGELSIASDTSARVLLPAQSFALLTEVPQ